MMLSRRSSSIATQPIPPSDIAILSDGCFSGYSLQSHSAQAASESWPNIVAPSWSWGAPSGIGYMPEEPTWSEITVSVSTQAWTIGSQCLRSQRFGMPTACGRSGKVTEVKPRSALRWISAAACCGSVR